MKNIASRFLIICFVILFVSACSVELEPPPKDATSREVSDGFIKAMVSGDMGKTIGYIAGSEQMSEYELMTQETNFLQLSSSLKRYRDLNYEFLGSRPDDLRGEKGIRYYYNFYDGNIGITQFEVIMILTPKGWRVVDL